MIISHKYKFIFIKTRKTAGTSLEIALSRICAAGDVISELGERPEVMEEFGYTGGRNFHVPMKHWTARDFVKLPLRGRPEFHSHSPAEYVRARVPDEIWNSYYTFCFERNPYDRIVSQYFWNTRKTKEDVHSYLKTAEYYRLSNWAMYTENDLIIVDHVARFENLQDELAALVDRLGLPGPIEMAQAKTEYRPKEKSNDILDDGVKALIAERCAREIAEFGYSAPD